MTLWTFPTSIQLQSIEKIEGGPLQTFKNFEKSHEGEKGAGKVSQCRGWPYCFAMVLYFKLDAFKTSTKSFPFKKLATVIAGHFSLRKSAD